jgi:hypothetical protein
MPLYEEKLISPLAIRFTQQRIRETFKDGREVENTIKEITALAGAGDYDVVLDAPFPAIEIIRWSQNGRKGGATHWYSFDNRRLYCFQRVAAALWPKRVAAKVEVLYADSGTIRKKLDSQTQGLCVKIGHANETEYELKEWSWHRAVQVRAPPGNFALQAEACIAADDAKTSLDDLMDVPSSVEQLSSINEAQAKVPQVSEHHHTPEHPSEVVEVELQSTSDGSANFAAQLRADYEAPSTSTCTLGDQSLTNLIGQLLKLKIDERSGTQDHMSDGSSTHVSEHADATDSDAGTLEAVTMDPSRQSSLLEFSPVSDEVVQVQPPACSNGPPAREQKKNKPSCKARPKQTQQDAAYMARAQMAQSRMAQWQMMHAAQVAQWQQASLAFHAHPAAHFRRMWGASC